LEEQAALLALMAEDERGESREDRAREYANRESRSRQTAARVRMLLLKGDFVPGPTSEPGLKE